VKWGNKEQIHLILIPNLLGYHVGSSNIAVQVGLPVCMISEQVVG
jgi:hypothetical protein